MQVKITAVFINEPLGQSRADCVTVISSIKMDALTLVYIGLFLIHWKIAFLMTKNK